MGHTNQMTSIAFRGTAAMFRRNFGSMLAKVSANSATNYSIGGYTSRIGSRNFSDQTIPNAKVVTRKLKKLDSATVQMIEAELREVDKDSDGRIDTNDLANLFKRRQSPFTDEDIVEFSELFYAGKANNPTMSVPEFIQTLDRVAYTEETGDQRHPILNGNCSAEYIYRKSHASYKPEDLDIELTHQEPTNFSDRAALQAVKIVRGLFDTATGWSNDKIVTQDKILNRVIFLETVAAVPGMVAAVTRHFRSLRRMERDGGLMHLFLEEANNERMHLLSFIKMKDPGMFFRGAVVLSQFGFGSAFFSRLYGFSKILPPICRIHRRRGMSYLHKDCQGNRRGTRQFRVGCLENRTRASHRQSILETR